jgi:hypothetical protein
MYAEAIEALSACQFNEAHPAAGGMTVDTGYINCAVATTREVNQRGGVELCGSCGIYGDAPPGTQVKVAIGVLREELGRASALSLRNGSASGAEHLPQCLSIGKWNGFGHAVGGYRCASIAPGMT